LAGSILSPGSELEVVEMEENRDRSWRKIGARLMESAFLAAVLAVIVVSALTVLGHGSA